MQTWESTRPPALEIPLYVVLATALCFVVASPALLDLVAVEFVGLVVVAAQTTPLIAALIFFALRRPGRFRDVFALGWGRSWPVLGIGLAVVVGAAVVQLGVGLWLGWELRAGEMIASAAVAVLPLLVVQSVFAIGEEWGWRGWLATRMERLGFWVAAAIGAAAWVVWHLPAVPLIVGDATWEFGAAYLLGIASWTPLMLWLRWASGSVWPAVVVHGAINSLRVFVLQSLADSGGGINWVVEAVGWAVWLGAAWLLARRWPGR